MPWLIMVNGETLPMAREVAELMTGAGIQRRRI
jgi:hypothetical protein